MPSDKSQSRFEAREHARERAREARAAIKRRERRSKVLVRSSILVGLVGVVSVVALVLVTSVTPAGPGPRNMVSDGIAIGKDFTAVRTAAREVTEQPVPTDTKKSTATADIRLYADFHCPDCKAFDEENGDYLAGLVKSGAATLEFHPIAIVDRLSSGSKYSTRSAAAAGCVADLSPNSYFAANALLMSKQPATGTPGYSNAELATMLSGIDGLENSAEVTRCVDDQRFASWVADATKRVTRGDIPGTDIGQFQGTPTVTVNGLQFDASQSSFKEFVTAALGHQGAPSSGASAE